MNTESYPLDLVLSIHLATLKRSSFYSGTKKNPLIGPGLGTNRVPLI